MVYESASVKSRRTAVWLVLALVLCGFAELFIVVGFRRITGLSDIDEASSHLDSDLKTAKAVGLPLEANDLDVTPPVSDQDNAALIIQQIDARYHSEIDPMNSAGLEDDLSLAVFHGDLSRVRSDLVKAKPLLDQSVVAASKSGFDPRHDWDLGPYMSEAEYETMKSCAHFLVYRAEIEAIDGDHQKAAADIAYAESLGDLLSKEPTLIGMLVRNSIDQFTMRGLNTCMGQAKNSAQLESYKQVVDRPRAPQDFLEVLRGESYMGIPVFRNEMSLSSVAGEGSGDPRSRFPGHGWKRTGLPNSKIYRAYLARHLEMWTEIMQAAKPYVSQPDTMFKKTGVISERYANDRRASCAFERVLAPIYSQAGNNSLISNAYRNISKEMYRVLFFRIANGRLPRSLADAGTVEIDPFTGKPLKYSLTSKDFRIYSVSWDQVDDHGNTHPGKGSTRDIVLANPPLDPMVRESARIHPVRAAMPPSVPTNNAS